LWSVHEMRKWRMCDEMQLVPDVCKWEVQKN